jgi:peroxiredoxin (alkyl hydroperoxide reductase subunit C)
LDHRIDTFTKLGVEVIGVPIDSHFTHNAWRNSPINQGGIGAVRYTLAADINHAIVKAYNVEIESGIALRGAFIINERRRCSFTRHQ